MSDPAVTPGAVLGSSDPAVTPGAVLRLSDPTVIKGVVFWVSDPAVIPGAVFELSDPAVIPGFSVLALVASTAADELYELGPVTSLLVCCNEVTISLTKLIVTSLQLASLRLGCD